MDIADGDAWFIARWKYRPLISWPISGNHWTRLGRQVASLCYYGKLYSPSPDDIIADATSSFGWHAFAGHVEHALSHWYKRDECWFCAKHYRCCTRFMDRWLDVPYPAGAWARFWVWLTHPLHFRVKDDCYHCRYVGGGG